MDMIEVDPKLFVTCRLCLEDLGQYQIVPSVQKQIKYCFDIDVAPFDGLPQLICGKCKQILINYYAIKESLCDKQAKLVSQVHQKTSDVICKPDQDTGVQPQQDAVSTSQQPAESTEQKKYHTKLKRVIESSDSEITFDAVQALKKKKTVKSRPACDTSWDYTGYKKYYTCRVCKRYWTSKQSFWNHSRTHGNLKITYSNIFNKNCSVMLQKIDDKPNLTGSNKLVVHNHNKITENCNSSLFYIRYVKATNHRSDTESNLSANESTDSDDEIVSKPNRRRRQLLSRSSNDTVVIETNSNKVVSDDESEHKLPDVEVAQSAPTGNYQCINIDDSDSDDNRSSVSELPHKAKHQIEAKQVDYKIIQGIITMCLSAYHRKNDIMEKPDKQVSTESHLKHKVLSIGRKIINGRYVNLTGILRYLEHKNLSIVWVTKPVPTTSSKDTNCIRIMTKLRSKETISDDYGWVPVDKPDSRPVVESDSCILQETPSLTQNLADLHSQDKDTAVLLFCNIPDPKSKLLNANPVANPKQLPRKLGQAAESRLNKLATESFQNVEDNNFMPIITSATSLAEPKVVDKQIIDNLLGVSASSIDKPAPRIKVKPVTELMSERTLQNLRNEQSSSISTSSLLPKNSNNAEVSSAIKNNLVLNQAENMNNIVLNQNVWPAQNQISNIYVPSLHLVPIPCINVTPTGTLPVVQSPTPSKSKTVNSDEECVLLSTPELPNTKTDSPFKYLSNLLRLYNLILFDPHETLPRDFVCLIKFKVQFKQEPIDEPVVLCLSLYCSKNKFCFTVKDRNQMNININKISPNWQWEILNVFRGDLVDKLLQNAQKHSQETRDFTNQFLCLLKSIKFTKLSLAS